MLKFTFMFTCIFTFTFMSKLLIILIPFMLQFGRLFTQTKTLNFMVELPWSLPMGGARVRMDNGSY